MSEYILSDYSNLASEFAIRNPRVVELLKSATITEVESELLNSFGITLIRPHNLDFVCFPHLHLNEPLLLQWEDILNQTRDRVENKKSKTKAECATKEDRTFLLNKLLYETSCLMENLQKYQYKNNSSKRCIVALKKRLAELEEEKKKRNDSFLSSIVIDPKINKIRKMIKDGVDALQKHNLYTKISIKSINPYSAFNPESEIEALNRIRVLLPKDGRKLKRIMNGEIFKNYDLINFHNIKTKNIYPHPEYKTLKTDTETIKKWIEFPAYLQLLHNKKL